MTVKLVVKVKLQPAPEQAEHLRKTLEVANAACDYASERAWNTDKSKLSKYDIQKLSYYDIRQKFGLSAQMTVRAVAKVGDAYTSQKEQVKERLKQRKAQLRRAKRKGRKVRRLKKPIEMVQCHFKPHGGFPYDNRILSWQTNNQTVSIWSVGGRLKKVAYTGSSHQIKMLQYQQGESDLMFDGEKFFLFATCEVPEADLMQVSDYLGVDRGVVAIAADSDGEIYSGAKVNIVRRRHRRLRSKLQKVGTRSAKRKLKKLSGKEERFARDTNHQISKAIVAKAKDTKRGIALENLTGISERITARKPQRATLKSWSFFQLEQFLKYKAERDGVPVKYVDPKNTSRECPRCGHIDKRNRPSQSSFKCVVCNLAGNADHFAAINISRRVVVNRPIVAHVDALSAHAAEPGLSAVTSCRL